MAVAEQQQQPGTGYRWQTIDWAMRAISMAIYLCDQAGLKAITLELEGLHERARQERERAS